MLITSLDNKKIKLISSLSNNKTRDNLGLFIVEGMHLVKEAYLHNRLSEILLLENHELEFDCDIETNFVTEKVMKKITNLNNSTVVGICKIDNSNEIKGNHILLLDDLQDPGNIGTIIRSSLAFNVDTIVMSPNCCSLYNDKVIRSTQGTLFSLNIVKRDLMETVSLLKEKGYLILGTDVEKGTDVRDVKCSKFALIMGNEGLGVKPELKEAADKNLYIKMNDNCESLNVGVATSILLYELGGRNEN